MYVIKQEEAVNVLWIPAPLSVAGIGQSSVVDTGLAICGRYRAEEKHPHQRPEFTKMEDN